MDLSLDEALRLLDTPNDPYNADLRALRTVVKQLWIVTQHSASVSPPKPKRKGA